MMAVPRQSLTRAGAIVALLAMAVPAVAELPRYDVAAYCRRTASLTGNYSAWLDNACVEQEQRAYDGLKVSWDALPADMRGHCESTTRIVGGSYWLLDACVQQEIRARKGAVRFKY
jgi:hypothetical protein